jgi:iron complex outermembrane receptor protein
MKPVKGFLASLLLFFTFLPAGARGQEEGIDDEFLLLEEAMADDEIKSASKHRQHIFWSPSAITVFTKEQIRSSGANSLHDLLRRVPGFDVYELKASCPLVGSRAMTDDSNNLILVLVDGREALIELSGFPIWAAMSIELEEIERIEVIRGPGSALYGANAFTGVVSITTVADRPEDGGDIHLSLGELGQRRLFGRVRGSAELGGGVLSYSAGLGTQSLYSSSDRRHDMLQLRVRSHGWLRYQKGRQLDLSLHAGMSEGDGGYFFHVGDFQGTNVLAYHVMGQAIFGLGEKAKLKTQFYYNSYYVDWHYRTSFIAFDVWVADVPDFFIDTYSVDGQVQLDYQILDDLLVIGGGNIRYTALNSDNVIPQIITELRGAGFIHVQWNAHEILQLTGGLRGDLNEHTAMALSPRVVAVLRPDANHAFRAAYGLAFRKPAPLENQMHMRILKFNPAMREIVDKLATDFGNENLTNEKAHSFEAGWRASFLDESLRTSVDLFFNIFEDLIYFQTVLRERLGAPDIENSIFSFVNGESNASLIGAELEMTWLPAEHWRLWASASLREMLENQVDEDEFLPKEPFLRLNLGVGYDSGSGLFADLALHYVTSYETALTDAMNPLDERVVHSLGETLLLLGRLGYRLELNADQKAEIGLTIRTPIGAPFREYAGFPIGAFAQAVTASDYGGEMLVRVVAAYLRGSF